MVNLPIVTQLKEQRGIHEKNKSLTCNAVKGRDGKLVSLQRLDMIDMKFIRQERKAWARNG